MQTDTLRFPKEFRLLSRSARGQVAEMKLAPGACTGGPDNRHRGSDQWLVVVSGHGAATVDGTQVVLAKGTVLLIEKGERHEIRNPGSEDLCTVNFYAPCAYDSNGERTSDGRS